jgi:hypothetical protein
MDEDIDVVIEQVIREAWAATGQRPLELPPPSDPRMRRMMEHLRDGSRRIAEKQIARVQLREFELEQRLAEIEARVRKLEERVGLHGTTLQ